MTVVLLFRLIDRLFQVAIKRLGFESRLGAWVAYYSGRVIFWQLRYVERIEKLSGWEPVQVQTPPRIPYQLYANGTVRHGFVGERAS